MNNKSSPDSGGKSVQQYVEEFKAQKSNPMLQELFMDWEDENEFIKPGDSPIFLTSLYFVNGFAKSFYNGMFNFMMQDDPVLGPGTFGNISRLGHERCAIMDKKLRELEAANSEFYREFESADRPVGPVGKVGLEKVGEFKRYCRAYSGLGNADKIYFKKMTTVFFERFRHTFQKHVASKWQKGSTFHYILGGDKYHAHAAASWIMDYDGTRDLVDVESDASEVRLPYAFPNRVVEMGGHHTMTRKKSIKVNLQDSMSYLTSELDREEIHNSPFVKKYKRYIQILADWHEPVDLLGDSVPKELEPLQEAIIREIYIHAIHQQRCENYVQLTGLISQTGVGETRRTNRAIIVANIIRRFNLWGLLKRNEELAKELDKLGNRKKPIKRLQGAPKIRLFLQFLDMICEEIDEAKVEIGDSKWKQICKRLGSIAKKASQVDREARLKKFKIDLESQRKEYKAEKAAGVEVTARVGGGIFLRLLTGTNTFAPHVDAEMRARKIPMSKRQQESWSLAEKRKKIRQHEFNRKCANESGFGRENNATDIQYIIPMSAELQHESAFSKQQKILDTESGILVMEESLV